MGTTIPQELWFNYCGVVMNPLRYECSFKGGRYRYGISVGFYNGMWGYSLSCDKPNAGFSGPLWYGSFHHPTFERCMELAKERIDTFFNEEVVKETLTIDRFVKDDRYEKKI